MTADTEAELAAVVADVEVPLAALLLPEFETVEPKAEVEDCGAVTGPLVDALIHRKSVSSNNKNNWRGSYDVDVLPVAEAVLDVVDEEGAAPMAKSVDEAKTVPMLLRWFC